MPSESDNPETTKRTAPPLERCCRNCEWWDAGGEKLKPTAVDGDCLNRHSDRFTPPWDWLCSQWMQET